MKRPGILFVIAAPSGTGKSTVARWLVERDAELSFSVSYTTRPPREGERDGVDYHFVDAERFAAMVAADAFLEHATVHGRSYGTGLEATRRALADGGDILLDIDVQGARQVRERAEIEVVSVMLLPPDRATLEGRLRSRGSEDSANLGRRLAAAPGEAEEFVDFDYVVLNRDLDRAREQLRAIVEAERCRTARQRGVADGILADLRQGTEKR